MVLTVYKADVRRFLTWIESADWNPCVCPDCIAGTTELLSLAGVHIGVIWFGRPCRASVWQSMSSMSSAKQKQTAVKIITDDFPCFKKEMVTSL